MPCCDAPNPYFPGIATAGLDFQASVSLPDYPAPAWTLAAYLRGPQSIDLLGQVVTTGNRHQFDVPASETTSWKPGRYWYSLRASRDGRVIEAHKGELTVRPDLYAAPEGFDGRSPNQIALEAIDAVIAKRASLDQERYRINNRELYRTSIGDLLKLRAYYASKVAGENNCKAGRSGFGRMIPVRFC